MTRSIFGVVLLAVVAGECPGQGTVTGFGRFEQIAGNPVGGYKQLYEWNLFFSPEGGGAWAGVSRRLGAPPGEVARGDGFFRIDGVPDGTYTLYVNQPDFFASPKVVDGVVVRDGQTTNLNVELDIDYSTYIAEPNQWTPWAPDAYQTFRATGTSVRGISWRHAGAYDDADAEVTLLEDNGDPDVRLWEVVATKTKQNIAGDTDEWIRFQSGEAPMVPGRQYAVRVHVDDGMAVYKRDKDGFSYAEGEAYDGSGVEQNWDLNVTVFVDRDGTSVTHTRTTSGPGEFDGALSAARWGQTFVASGTSLAAVDLFAASVPQGFPVTWQVFEDGPGGVPVGDVKTVASAFFASTTGLAGAGFARGEVPLTEGETYYIEARYAARLTPYTMEPWNAYADGQAFRDGVAQPDLDLSMTIVEYFEPEIVFEFSTGTVIPPGGVLDATINHLSGVLSPEGARRAGELLVTGGYRGSAAGGLRFDFLADQFGGHDVLIFEGDVDLAGTLDLAVRPGFVAQAGEEFVILTAPAISGSFSEVVRSNAGDGLAFDVVVTDTEVKAVVVAGDKPAIDSFRATPAVVASGGSATLSWTVTGADGLALDPLIGDVTGLDSQEVFPQEDADLEFVSTGSMWAVFDSRDGVPAVDWAAADFDDSGWPVGPAEIGYGDGDEAAVWNIDPADPNKPITMYFRHEFELGEEQLASLDSLIVLLKRDDGAVVYLNGVEVARDNLPEPPAVIGPDTLALRGVGNEEEGQFFLFDVAQRPLPLNAGRNVVAVEVHQVGATSSDVSMDLALIGTGALREVELSGAGETWRYADDGVDYFAPAVPFFDVAFDDSGWDSGVAEFGYGDGDEATLWDFGGDEGNKFPVYYARRTFDVPAALASRATGGGVYVKADDGAAVFVNGGETMRSNLDPGFLDGLTLAPGFTWNDGGDFVFGEFGDDVLAAGANVVAASVHQSSATSSDTSFDLRVVAQIPASTNLYTLSATNRFGTSEATVVVEVGEPAPEDFRVTSVVREAGGDVVLRWGSEVGVSYRVERSADLKTWTAVGGDVVAAATETEQRVALGAGGEVYLRVVRLP